MIRYALLVQYDGTYFNGWQLQDKGRTIQGEFEKAVKILTKEDARVTASGRTDSGVHALGQVIHFDLLSEVPLTKLCISLNGILPNEISVKNAYRVCNNFHSRYSAIEREYVYLIYRYPLRSPFIRYKAMWINHSLELQYMREALSYLIGEKDFAAFCKKVSAANGTVRKIESIELSERDYVINIRFRANAFLHNMIRIIVGTVVQMYREEKKPSFIQQILDGGDRSASGFTAPPYGLYLDSVKYEPSLDYYESAF